MISLAQGLLGFASGNAVGLSLGLVGGGGSILAVPLLIYVVGVPSVHAAIGTSALVVAINAAVNLAGHLREGTLKWPCTLVFAAAGVAGATFGSALGKTISGDRLLALFAILMLVVGTLMLKQRKHEGNKAVRIGRDNVPALVGLGFASGALSGFFGIGGGFLIVPALMLATGMPILNAVHSSLAVVAIFGATAAASYAWSGLVDWWLAAVLIAGGAFGGLAGAHLGRHLAAHKSALSILLSSIIVATAIYILTRALFFS